jgi:putative ABC transport system permease protein
MWFYFKLVLRNAFRHKLRAALTMVGLVVAIMAFGLLRTIVESWYAGVAASSSARLVTRNAISLVFPLPLNYASRMRQIDGVTGVSWANWFGGIYIEPKNFFPQFAIDAPSYLPMYPEFVLDEAERRAFLTDRQGAMVGRKIANQFGWKIGDQVSLRGTIYSGTWTFNIRAIYDGRQANTDETQFFFHWQYLNEEMKKRGRAGDQVGVYVLTIRDPDAAADTSRAIDALFRSSSAETLTETESAFQLNFVAMTEAILAAVQSVSFVIIFIIMAVMANTIAMTARERTAEYATLQAVGFAPRFVGMLLLAESLLLALIGGAVGVLLTFPMAAVFGKAAGTFFPVFQVSDATVLMQLAAAAVIGLVAAAVPAWRISQLSIVNGLRHVA